MSRWSTSLTSEQRWRPGNTSSYFIAMYIQCIKEFLQPDDQLHPRYSDPGLLIKCRERFMRKEGKTAQISMGLENIDPEHCQCLGSSVKHEQGSSPHCLVIHCFDVAFLHFKDQYEQCVLPKTGMFAIAEELFGLGILMSCAFTCNGDTLCGIIMKARGWKGWRNTQQSSQFWKP